MIFEVLLVVVGFGLIVFVHELGHFLAARWAGIRVLAFAIGFGPSLLTYRQGLGVRRGSTEREYFERVRAALERGDTAAARALSPTEYRLNVLPFGGYVKMLGQDDLDPNATSAAPDSYQRAKVWKRMVVISAGVVMNIITAAILFVIVMMVGRQVEPPIVGAVDAGGAAAEAVALDAPAEVAFASSGQGLRTGDRILRVDGSEVRTFDDVVIAAAMAEEGKQITLTVERPGSDLPEIALGVTPRMSVFTSLLDLGIEPARATTLVAGRTPEETELLRTRLAEAGLVGVEPGATLLRVAGKEAKTGSDLFAAIERGDGAPVVATFRNPDGREVDVTLTPKPRLQTGLVALPAARRGQPSHAAVQHVLGLTGVMRVVDATEAAMAQGLRSGDVFARVGDSEFPAVHEGVREIRSRAGESVRITVLRPNTQGGFDEVDLPTVRVSSQGTVGFTPGDTSSTIALLAGTQRELMDSAGIKETSPAAALGLGAGTRIISVDGTPVASLLDVREQLRSAAARASGAGAWAVLLEVQRPVRGVLDQSAPTTLMEWRLSATDAALLARMSYTIDVPTGVFTLQEATLKADNPLAALRLGALETKRVMLLTYLTFARLFEGTIKVEHLKGPVGITHLGTLVSDRGFIWLLFFLAMISVNLAVVNFLPLPIVDGGQFLFLVYEALRGRPVPIAVQNAVTMVGLVAIGALFLLVTYNDIRNLLGL